MVFVLASALAIIAVLAVPQVAGPLRAQSAWLPWIAVAMASIVPLTFLYWYSCSFVEVRRGHLCLRSIRSRQIVDLRTLVSAEVYARGRGASKGKPQQLSLWMEDEAGRELHLPLNSWQDEQLLMARVLRATVDRKVRIDGEPALVERFAGLLESYKSWDRQQRMAA
ncbi:MAG: hypothetical protein JWM25_1808 [Thermoleophilia bacterium]|nr:hypothetical protein [Thermoleophilia bacterium]MCZ4497223.1 hypothetical protein [Thermoleophilia bacterium]